MSEKTTEEVFAEREAAIERGETYEYKPEPAGKNKKRLMLILAGACPSLEISQICKRLYCAGHSVALLKTCFKCLQCPVACGLHLDHDHGECCFQNANQTEWLSYSEPLVALL